MGSKDDEKIIGAIESQVAAEKLLTKREREILNQGEKILLNETGMEEGLEKAKKLVPGFREVLRKVTELQRTLEAQ